MIKYSLYFLIFIFLLGAEFLYFRIARYYQITDTPNERSSHRQVTIRGAGIIFPLAALVWILVWGQNHVLLGIGLILVATISFADDLKPLSGKLRLAVQLPAMLLMFADLGILSWPLIWILVLMLLSTWWINAFNFMDGINGITPLYAITFIATLFFVPGSPSLVPHPLLISLTIALAIFCWFNCRKNALAFAGDVGSISLAFMIAWLLIHLVVTSGNHIYLIFLSVYAADSLFTIIHRIWRSENIFKAHRFHLYQLLANEAKWPHMAVAGLFAGIQLMINAGVLWLTGSNKQGMYVIPIIGVTIISYLIVRLAIVKRMFGRLL